MGKVTWHGWSTSYDQIPESSPITFVKARVTEDLDKKGKKLENELKIKRYSITQKLPNLDGGKMKPGETIMLDQRQQSSMVSSWTEYLCLDREADGSYALAVKGYEILGSISEYYNEETEQYEIPDEIDGESVIGQEDEYIVGGSLQSHSDEIYPLEFAIPKKEEIEEWLSGVANWDPSIVTKVLEMVTMSGADGESVNVNDVPYELKEDKLIKIKDID